MDVNDLDGAADRTTVHGIVIEDDQWSWLGDYAARLGVSRASVIRRVLFLLRLDESSGWDTLTYAMATAPDPVAERRTDALRRRSDG